MSDSKNTHFLFNSVFLGLRLGRFRRDDVSLWRWGARSKKRSRVTYFFPAHLNERKSAIKKISNRSFSPESKRFGHESSCTAASLITRRRRSRRKKSPTFLLLNFLQTVTLPNCEPTPHAPAHIPTEAVYHQVGAELSARLICRLSDTNFSHLWLRKMPACTNTHTAFCFPTIIWANPDSNIISAHFSLHKLLSNNVFFNSARCRSGEHKVFHTQNKHSEKHTGSR